MRDLVQVGSLCKYCPFRWSDWNPRICRRGGAAAPTSAPEAASSARQKMCGPLRHGDWRDTGDQGERLVASRAKWSVHMVSERRNYEMNWKREKRYCSGEIKFYNSIIAKLKSLMAF
jgi:hypothetical protein